VGSGFRAVPITLKLPPAPVYSQPVPSAPFGISVGAGADKYVLLEGVAVDDDEFQPGLLAVKNKSQY
jgi:hypothetical protein